MSSVIVASNAIQLRRDLRAALERDGHSVIEAVTLAEALREIRLSASSLLVLDSGLEGLDGTNACRAIRAESDLGIIALIRDSADQSRIDALNAGADDYLVVPYVVGELLARVRAVFRRTGLGGQAVVRIVLHDRAIDLPSHKVRGPGNSAVHLTPKECSVLKHLVSRQDKLVTKQDLAQAVWNRDGLGDLEYIRVVICALRRKIERDRNHPEYILTEHSAGYRFALPALAAAAIQRGNDSLTTAP